MYTLTVHTTFSAAHNLRHYRGRCERLHGHNYRLEVAVGGAELNELGMLMDFSALSDLVERVVEGLDHQYLNQVPPFDTINPTAENIARHVAGELGSRLPDGAAVRWVACWESDNCAARYTPPAAPGPGSQGGSQ